MKIEKGKFYVTRNGDVVGPMRLDWNDPVWKVHTDTGHLGYELWDMEGNRYMTEGVEHRNDLVKEFVEKDEVEDLEIENPVKEITQIIGYQVYAGTYGRVSVKPWSARPEEWVIGLTDITGDANFMTRMTAAEMRAAAITFNQLADYFEENE